jgi:hypothetical protein
MVKKLATISLSKYLNGLKKMMVLMYKTTPTIDP